MRLSRSTPRRRMHARRCSVLADRARVDRCAAEHVDGACDAAVGCRERAVDDAVVGENLARRLVHIVIRQLVVPHEVAVLGVGVWPHSHPTSSVARRNCAHCFTFLMAILHGAWL
eukprot:6584779-Prymnesium_polylepis.1